MIPHNTPLGQATVYIQTYTPELLFPVPRSMAREKTGISDPLPFHGMDIWNGYELSWLNQKGKPEIALAQFMIPCSSKVIVESKSFKLYLNSFNQTKFESMGVVEETIRRDLSKVIEADVFVKLYSGSHFNDTSIVGLSGICLDEIDIEFTDYEVNPEFLKMGGKMVQEVVYSDLFKSNCLATKQPDWGSIWIHYVGPQIDREGLLRYLVSYRNHSGFAEHCVEQVFYDLMRECKPEKLSVYGRYTRRGGLDINPFRSNFEDSPPHNIRQPRQ